MNRALELLKEAQAGQRDINELNIREVVTIEKFDGPAPKPGEHKDPVEVVNFEDGVIVNESVNKENELCQ